MAALRRMDPPSYGEWQHEQYGYGGYGSQTLPAPGGAAPAARGKAKLGPPARDPAALKPPPPAPGKSAAKVNGSGPGWWPECTCSSRDWYEQVRASPGQRLPGAGRDGAGGCRGSPGFVAGFWHGAASLRGRRGQPGWMLELLGLDAGVVAVGRRRHSGWPSESVGLALPLFGLDAAVLPSVGAQRWSSLPRAERGQMDLAWHKVVVGRDVFWTPHLRCSLLTMPLPEALAASRASRHPVFSRHGACCPLGSLVGSRCCLPALPNCHPLSIELWFPCSAATSLLPEIIT